MIMIFFEVLHICASNYISLFSYYLPIKKKFIFNDFKKKKNVHTQQNDILIFLLFISFNIKTFFQDLPIKKILYFSQKIFLVTCHNKPFNFLLFLKDTTSSGAFMNWTQYDANSNLKLDTCSHHIVSNALDRNFTHLHILSTCHCQIILFLSFL